MKETIIYEEMCKECQKDWDHQHSGVCVLDYLVVCNHQPERSKREDLTTCSFFPEDLEKILVDQWKKQMLS